MKRTEILTELRNLMVDKCIGPSDSKKITESASLIDDLDMDWLYKIELVMELEEYFGIDIRDEDADRWLTIGDAVGYLEKMKVKKPAAAKA